MEQNQSTELTVIAEKSGIEFSRAEAITLKYVPFLLEIRKAEEESKKINFDSPTELDEKIARQIRLNLVPNRTEADKFKKAEKAETILLNGLHDDAYGIVEKTSKLLELKLSNVEKQREIIAKAKVEALKISRIELINPYGENYAQMDLGNMSDEMFDSIFTGAKLSYEAKIKAELEIEAKRIEDEKLANEEREKQRLEMERLKKENEIKEKQIELERIEAAKSADAAKKKADAELAEVNRLAKIESEKQAKIISDQKIESEKLAAELKAKADAELKAKQELEAIEKQRLSDEKKAAKAPDKEKMKVWINALEMPFVELKQNESNVMASDIKVKFTAFKKWALTQIETI
jgi:hypothetical protein